MTTPNTTQLCIPLTAHYTRKMFWDCSQIVTAVSKTLYAHNYKFYSKIIWICKSICVVHFFCEWAKRRDFYIKFSHNYTTSPFFDICFLFQYYTNYQVQSLGRVTLYCKDFFTIYIYIFFSFNILHFPIRLIILFKAFYFQRVAINKQVWDATIG